MPFSVGASILAGATVDIPKVGDLGASSGPAGGSTGRNAAADSSSRQYPLEPECLLEGLVARVRFGNPEVVFFFCFSGYTVLRS